MSLITTTAAKFGVVAFLAKERDGVIQVIDLWPTLTAKTQAVTSTVTDAPQTVINELARRGFPVNDRPIVYLDENEVWDVIKVHNGNFDNFMTLAGEKGIGSARRWQQALASLVSGGVLTPKDLRRGPVVGHQSYTVKS